MAGLDVYLKEFCDRGGFLVIDEPEMNAHPEGVNSRSSSSWRFLAHHGVRVVLTTHSPYIVDHLSNLMQASRLSDEAKTIASHPNSSSAWHEAFLTSGRRLSIPVEESGGVEDILDREQGIIDLSEFQPSHGVHGQLGQRDLARRERRRLKQAVEQSQCRLITCCSILSSPAKTVAEDRENKCYTSADLRPGAAR